MPILVGEFSVVRWAPKEDAERYLADLVELFEEFGWSWCYHGLRDYHGWSLLHTETYGDLIAGKGRDPALPNHPRRAAEKPRMKHAMMHRP